MRAAYTTERGDVLMSVQGELLREDRRAGIDRSFRSRPARLGVVPPGARPVARRLRAPVPSVTAQRAWARPLPARRLGPRFRLVGMTADFREDMGESARETVLTVICDAARQVLGDDRVYRTGPSEVAFLLRDSDDVGAEVAGVRVEARARRLLAERLIHTPRLTHTAVEPGLVLGARAASVPA